MAKLVIGIVARRAPGPDAGFSAEPVDVNGEPGPAFVDGAGASMGGPAFEVADGRITAACVALNPAEPERVGDGRVSGHLPRGGHA